MIRACARLFPMLLFLALFTTVAGAAPLAFASSSVSVIASPGMHPYNLGPVANDDTPGGILNAGDTINVYGHFFFTAQNGEVLPVQYATVALYDRDDATLDDFLGNVMTDENGYFAFTGIVNTDDIGTLDIYLDCMTANSRMVLADRYPRHEVRHDRVFFFRTPVMDNIDDPYHNFNAGDYVIGSASPVGVDNLQKAFWIWDNLRIGQEFFDATGNRFPTTYAQYDTNAIQPHTYEASFEVIGDTLHFLYLGRMIDLSWSSFYREMAHMEMWQVYQNYAIAHGTVNPFDLLPAWHRNMWPPERTSQLAAWIDGMAIFLAQQILGNPLYYGDGWSVNLETGEVVPGAPNDSAYFNNGDMVTGRVAGAIYDLWDNEIDGTDRTSTDFTTLWAIFTAHPYQLFRDYFMAIVNHDSAREAYYLGATQQNTIHYGWHFYPDLAVIDVTAPIIAEESAMVSCAVSDVGYAPSGYLYDVAFYVTTTDTWDPTTAVQIAYVFDVDSRFSHTTIVRANADLSGLADGDYYVWAFADPNNQIVEVNEENNLLVSGRIMRVGYLPDLMPLELTAVQTDNIIDFTLLIRNDDLGDAPAYNVAFYLCPTPTFDLSASFMLDEVVAPPLGHLAFTFVTGQGNLFGIARGTYYLFAVADPHGDLRESNEENNVIASTTDFARILPDLQVQGVFGHQEDHQLVLEADIVNNSLFNAVGLFYTGFWLSTDDVFDPATDIYIEGPRLLNLLNGRVQHMVVYTDAAVIPEGEYTIFVNVDQNNAIDESVEDNNIGTGTVYVGHEADLWASRADAAFTYTTNSVAWGFYFSNIGYYNIVPSFHYKIYLSVDPVYSPGDLLLFDGTYTDLILSHSGLILVSGTSALPDRILRGTYYIVGVVDADYQVAERSEFNNQSNSFGFYHPGTILSPRAGMDVSDGSVTGIMPNPASSHVALSFNMPAGAIRVEAYNELGGLVSVLADRILEADGPVHLDWNVSDLATGTYLVRVVTANGEETHRVGVQH